jgi:hypothetical protein
VRLGGIWYEGGYRGADTVDGVVEGAAELAEGVGAWAVSEMVEVSEEVAGVSFVARLLFECAMCGELVAFDVEEGMGVSVKLVRAVVFLLRPCVLDSCEHCVDEGGGVPGRGRKISSRPFH